MRYAIEGLLSGPDPKTAEVVPPLELRETDTSWNNLPEIEAEDLADGRVAVTLPEEKLAALPELIEASLVYVAPRRTEGEENDFRLRFATSTAEAEALRDELWLIGRKLRSGNAARNRPDPS